MGNFKRSIDFDIQEKFIKNLTESDLYKSKLLPDITENLRNKGATNVFPAIRNNRIDFYFYNSLLFEYTKGEFKTHSKFAFVPKTNKQTYVKHGEEVGEIADFIEGYENIKERAKLYSGLESTGVYYICKNGNILSNNELRYIVLDIEIDLTGKNEKEDIINGVIDKIEKPKRDNKRLDILLYDTEEKELLFVEAKHYTNGELKCKKNGVPVVEQIKNYNKKLENKDMQNEIIQEYGKYIENFNKIFKNELKGKKLHKPEKICTKCGMIIFGFDGDQKKETLNKEILPNLKEIPTYSLGNVNDNKITEKLYNSIKKKI